MAAATMYVTVAGSGGSPNTGTAWNDSFSAAEFFTDVSTASEAGDVYYVETSTYTTGGNLDMSARDGTNAAPIKIIGVVTGTSAEPPTVSDWGTGANRPTIALATRTFRTGDYWQAYNLLTTSQTSTGFRMDGYSNAFNCKFTDSLTPGAGRAFYSGSTSCQASNCEAAALVGDGMYFGSSYAKVLFSYIHDCGAHGIYMAQSASSALFNVVDECVGTGIAVAGARIGVIVLNNTVYKCGKGIDLTGCVSGSAMNNILDQCTVGVEADSALPGVIWDYNNFHSNGTDRVNVAAGPNDTTADPTFTTDGSDFSLQSGSGCIDAALSVGGGVG